MYARCDGTTLAYDIEGQGEVVLLIHALGLDRHSWWMQVPELAIGWRVIACDLRGHGESDKPPGPYSIDLMAEDIAGLLRTLDIPSARIVGLSLGGMVAQALALAHPQLVDSLVLCDTTSGYSPEQSRVFRERAETVRRHGMEPIVEPTLERWLTAPFRQERPDVVERIARSLRQNDPQAYAAATEAVGNLALTDRLSQVRCPTLVVVGEEDPGTPPEMARELAERIRGARLEVIPRAAHLVPVEKATVFNALLREFLPTL